jgi:hypothetical protein
MTNTQSVIAILDAAIASSDVKEQENALRAGMEYCMNNYQEGLLNSQDFIYIHAKLNVLSQTLGIEPS